MHLREVYFWTGAYIIFYFISSTSPLERYKDIAQAPETGVHRLRICGFTFVKNDVYSLQECCFAFVDVFATLALSFYLARKYGWSTVNVFVVLVFISVPVHMLFGVETKLIRLINQVKPNFRL